MTTTLLTGALSPSDLVVRSDGRTIVGIAAPYGVEARVYDPDVKRWVVEGFEHRSTWVRGLDRPQRVKLYLNHGHREGKLPVGTATLLRDDTAGLYAELHAVDTDAGNEAVELVRSGTLDALSVGFFANATADRWSADGRSVVRVDAELREVSAVGMPAYAGADVLAVRDDEAPRLAHPGRARAIGIRAGLLERSYRSRP